MKILLRHLNSGQKETVELAAVPRAGDEIHWADRILAVHKAMWFDLDDGSEFVACLYVREI